MKENFLWERVYRCMKELDWEWSREGVGYIPSVDAIKVTARYICWQAYQNETGFCSTGGFTAKFQEDCLHLAFIIEDWTAEYE